MALIYKKPNREKIISSNPHQMQTEHRFKLQKQQFLFQIELKDWNTSMSVFFSILERFSLNLGHKVIFLKICPKINVTSELD